MNKESNEENMAKTEQKGRLQIRITAWNSSLETRVVMMMGRH
jgi:hypothetical protein